jgi:hypothetical protein
MIQYHEREAALIGTGDTWKVSDVVTRPAGVLPARGQFWRRQDAPSESLDLLWGLPPGTEVFRQTAHSKVYRCGEYAIKVAHERVPRDSWERMYGVAALAVNVALEEGLTEDSVLASGYRITTPSYYGAVFFPGHRTAKVVMSFEEGVGVQWQVNDHLAMEPEDRRPFYREALVASGLDPAGAAYDDGKQNLLLRTDTQELVKLDAEAWRSHAELLGT